MSKEVKLSQAFIEALSELVPETISGEITKTAELTVAVLSTGVAAFNIEGKDSVMYVTEANTQCNPKTGTTTLSVKSGDSYITQVVPLVKGVNGAYLVFTINEGNFEVVKLISREITKPSASGCAKHHQVKLDPRSMNTL